MKECVEHFNEGRNAWKLGLVGFFSRIRGIIFTVFLTLLTMGTPLWWPNSFSGKLAIGIKYIFIVFVLIVGIVGLVGFTRYRSHSRRILDLQHHLHVYAHYLRDNHISSFDKSVTVGSTGENIDKEFTGYIEGICNRLKSYFAELTKDKTVEIAIRLAVDKIVRGKHEIVYHTIGRSSGLNRNRADNTEDIKADEGIAGFLIDKGGHGVLIYNDLEKAAKLRAYKITQNDRDYPDEIRTMMVAPLIGWDGDTQSMIGILYITSRENKVFSVRYVDAVRFIADLTASFISSMLWTVEWEYQETR